MQKYPKVFVVILNFNGKEVLLNCLASVFKVNYPDFSVIVVDNNSDDGSLEKAKKIYPRTTYIKNEANLGFSAGNNVGIKYALEKMADYVLLLNSDTVVAPDFLAKLVEAGEKDRKIGILSPVIFEKEKNKIWFSGGEIKWFSMKAVHKRGNIAKKLKETEFISGCSMLVKKEVFKKVGLLDEDFFLYWEDTDFSFRTRKKGFRLMVVPESRIIHLEKSRENSKSKVYWLVVSGLIFFKKNTPFFLRPWICLFVILRRLKNWQDVRKERGEFSKTVKKAYGDFKKYA